MASKDCSIVSTIQDVNNQYNYTDTHSGGLGDWNKVSCGQNGIYNELKDKFKKYFSHYSETSVAKAMCECCKLFSGKPWEDFYACLRNKGLIAK